MEEQTDLCCPHCGQKMKKWQTPPDSTWGLGYKHVCFNDDCPYFVRGWDWMWEHYSVRSSYRHSVDPRNKKAGPLPVWSKDALKDHIIEE